MIVPRRRFRTFGMGAVSPVGYPDFASFQATVIASHPMCPQPYDPSCENARDAAISADLNAWVTNPNSCNHVVCDANGNPVVSYQSYTTPQGTAAAGVGYNTTSGFVPVAPVQPPAPPPPPPPAPPPAPPASYRPTLSFTTSRGSTALQPGDTWTISITGAQPNTPVILTAVSPATPGGATGPMGTADASGNFSLSGTITADQAGTWSESWKVGGATAGSFSFTVTAPMQSSSPATAPGGPSAPPGSPTPIQTQTPPTTASTTATTAPTATDFFSAIPWWGWAAAAAVVVVMASQGGKR